MPELARNRYYNSDFSRNYYTNKQIHAIPQPLQKPIKRVVDRKKVERNFFIHRIISVAIVSFFAFTILPYGFNRVTKHLFNPTPYSNIKVDYHQLVFPTTNYIANHWFMGSRFLENSNTKKPKMTTLVENKRLTGVETLLSNLAAEYPSIHPSIYAWDYQTGNYIDINADEIFPTASIIKLPVIAELFRAIERNQIILDEAMPLTEYYRTEGSGSIQYKAENSKYTLDTLARLMITESDNSATNMLISRLGSMTAINSAIRQWGLKHTYVQNWLPDLEGTNHSTGRDIATILYNIDNPEFLNNSSREKIFDYMGHVHNNRLIAAGLPAGTEFLHKTGDIGKMLGDAGIVYTQNGKKYVVVIMANRPHNSVLGKEFIVRASEIIYNNMVY